MGKKLTLFLFLISACLLGQETPYPQAGSHFIVPEFLFGKTMPANTNFSETRNQTGYFLSFGKYQNQNPHEWAYRLNYPRTGLTIGVTDYGNPEKVGYSISVIPYLEFDILRKKKKDLHLAIGMGSSYFNQRFDTLNNPLNKGVSTHFTWTFKAFVYYDIFKTKATNWRLGAGYTHSSNGHTRLPNQGFNSFFVSASAMLHYRSEQKNRAQDSIRIKPPNNSSNSFYSLRTGIGQNVLSQIFNDRKEVYSIAFSYGKTYNKTYKFGGGVFYRFYEGYYDYIKSDEKLMQTEFKHFKEKPFSYATNYGVFGSAELLLNHVGFEVQIGLNIYKPFYQVDWTLNQGYEYERVHQDGTTETVVVLGVPDSYFELKRTISSRMALKYYLIGTNKNPKHNLYLGAAINANLGQADFTEINLGYVYSFNFKESKHPQEFLKK